MRREIRGFHYNSFGLTKHTCLFDGEYQNLINSHIWYQQLNVKLLLALIVINHITLTPNSFSFSPEIDH